MSESLPEGTGPAGTGTPGTEGPPATQQQNAGTGATPPPEVDYKADAEKLREELKRLRKFEDQVKALRPKAQKFDELQQAAMSAEERAQLSVETAQREREEAVAIANETKRELAVLRAGVKHGFSEEDLLLLEGVSTDKIETVAASLAKRLGKADTPNFDGGPRTPPPQSQDMGTFLSQQIDRARGRR